MILVGKYRGRWHDKIDGTKVRHAVKTKQLHQFHVIFVAVNITGC